MKPIRRLALRREALAELTTADLAAVAAGEQASGTLCSAVEECPSGRAYCSLLCPQSWHTEPC